MVTEATGKSGEYSFISREEGEADAAVQGKRGYPTNFPAADEAKRGFFLTLEGADGCGKSTKARFLAADLEALGREVLSIRDPGCTPTSERIREILLDPAGDPLVPECELLLYEAARAQMVRELIIPALERGAIVICDRFTDSTIAYQAFGHGIDIELVRRANAMGSCGLVPDRTIVFDMDTDESFERATRHGADRLELEGLELQERVRVGYAALAKAEPGRIRVVWGSGEKAEVYGRMLAELVDVLPECASIEAHD